MDDCPKCGRKMEMYYGPWCPACDKPKRKAVETLNLIQALRHIEVAHDQPGYKDRMWKMLIHWDVIQGNDTFVPWYLEESWCQTDQELEDFKLFVETFDLENSNVLIEISW